MKSTGKERLIKSDILSIENRVRHVFNQGYDLGYKEGIEKKQSKTGHWKKNETIRLTYCSECGFGQHIDDFRTYNYCPNCGAKMVEPQESEVQE